MRKSRASALIACVVGLLMLVSITACGDDEGSNGGGGGASTGGGGEKTIAVNMYSREIPYFQEILKGMEAKAKEYGWKIEPTFANNDPTQQINQVQNAVTKRPDALVVVPIDESAIVPPIRAANEAGVPAMTMGDNIAEEARDAQLTFLGVDYKELGKQKAELIVEELGGKGSVGWVHGIRGINFSEEQVRGGKPVFEAAPGIKLVDGPYTGAFSSDKGLDATQNLLSRDANLDALYFDNDDIALGGIRALADRGIDGDDVLVVATDGGPAALEAVKKGDIDATFSLCGYAQGVKAMELLRGYLVDKTKPEPIVYTETLLFTPENAEENLKKVESGAC